MGGRNCFRLRPLPLQHDVPGSLSLLTLDPAGLRGPGFVCARPQHKASDVARLRLLYERLDNHLMVQPIAGSIRAGGRDPFNALWSLGRAQILAPGRSRPRDSHAAARTIYVAVCTRGSALWL